MTLEMLKPLIARKKDHERMSATRRREAPDLRAKADAMSEALSSCECARPGPSEKANQPPQQDRALERLRAGRTRRRPEAALRANPAEEAVAERLGRELEVSPHHLRKAGRLSGCGWNARGGDPRRLTRRTLQRRRLGRRLWLTAREEP